MRSIAIVALFACTSFAAADEKPLAGNFSKKVEGFTLKMVFLKDSKMQFSMSNGTEGCVLDAKYTLEKDGTLKCEVTKFEKMGGFPADKEVGYKFSFKAQVKGKVAKISDFDGKDIDDEAKRVLEGDYDKSE